MMDIAFVAYPEMTALDLVGPYEVLAGHPTVRPSVVAARPGAVRCDAGLVVEATKGFDEMLAADVVVVPGSQRWRRALDDAALLAWLATAYRNARWTLSVCTGSTLLAAAGVLVGRPATTHWAAREDLARLGALVRTDRVVIDDDVVSAAGASAGIDGALSLAALLWNAATAATLQLALEYDPMPPFDAGSPDKAGPAAVAAVRRALGVA
jgi:transcriptional regulator GlxA family with amidase domain